MCIPKTLVLCVSPSRITLAIWVRVRVDLRYSPLKKQGDWAELAFAKVPGLFLRTRKKLANSWPALPMASNDPSKNCVTHIGFIFLLVSKVANCAPVQE